MQERTSLGDALEGVRRIERELADHKEMIALGEAEKDQGVIAEAEAALKKLRDEVKRRELEAMLGGEADMNDSYVEVHAGAGGTESQDWAQMLMRMYVRWAESARLQGRASSTRRWARGRASSRRRSRSRARTPTAGSRRRPACIAWCASRRSTPTRAATRRSPR